MKLIKLEAARGFTAAFVFFAHWPGPKPIGVFHFVWMFAQEMVITFFVLSGFVIYYSSKRTLEQGFAPYFWRRFLRIYAIFLPLIAIMCFLEREQLFAPGFIPTLIGNLFMLQDTEFAKPGVIVPTVFHNLPLWSLHYEWWFYMAFFPLALCLPDKVQKHVVGGLGVVASIVYFFTPHFIPRLLMYLVIWWIGAEAARLYMQDRAALTLRGMKYPMIYVLLTAVPALVKCAEHFRSGAPISFGLHPFLEARHLLAGAAIVLAAFAWRAVGWFGYRWLIGPFALLAPISYSLYISHFPLLVHAKYFAFIVPRSLQLAAYTGAVLLFCASSELALYPWLRRRLTRTRPIAASTSVASIPADPIGAARP